ncbi:hypothetical protein RRG08_057449 [Elysia crispata]|uniref:Uncharacterized protein n=1 Tax=Elysia crispata TaxID=231223 RepID=A0AAE1D9F2_9GAST|nr:hypothetical protein RRG08_057449 [Elysia crispata]
MERRAGDYLVDFGTRQGIFINWSPSCMWNDITPNLDQSQSSVQHSPSSSSSGLLMLSAVRFTRAILVIVYTHLLCRGSRISLRLAQARQAEIER